jgi:hypothetical protein
MTHIKVKKGSLEHKKHLVAGKMAKSLDSATNKDLSKYPKHGGQSKHGAGVTKGLSF